MTADPATLALSRRAAGAGGASRPAAVLPAAALDRNAALAPVAAWVRAAGAADPGRAELIAAALPEIAAAVGARAATLIGPPPHFRPLHSWGRAEETPPRETLADCLDRDAARLVECEDDPSSLAMVLPGGSRALPLAVLTGRGLAATDLPGAWAAVRCLGATLPSAAGAETAGERADRFERLAAAAARLASVRESGPLLEALAAAACDLLDCDRASIFLHLPDPAGDDAAGNGSSGDDKGGDSGPGRLVGRPALGVEGGELSISADAGGRGGSRSAPGRRSAWPTPTPTPASPAPSTTAPATRPAPCWPSRCSRRRRGARGGRRRARGADRPVGVFEAVNKHGGPFTALDAEVLAALAPHAAAALANATERDALVRSRDAAAARAADAADGRIRLIGVSPAVATLRDTVNRLAATDLPVLVTGESGTGKEVVATCLHDRGPRSDGPFVAVNCAALTESLLESELFGHERGAFTDAREARAGKFELADGGTLFLDEIGDMSPGGQAKLLRVLEQRVVTRVGGSKAIPVDVRVVAATNADLAEKVAEKSFRADLYYRLGVVTHHLPPLRERPEDVIPLAEHFLATFAAKAGKPLPRLSAEARKRLQAHGWPGNVRELRNTIERVVYLGGGEVVEPAELTFLLAPGRRGSPGRARTRS